MEATTSILRLRPIIRVFVSSTFSDMKHERNALEAEVYPKLERICQKNGFQFQAIDLRWGVSTETGFDHCTMRICFDELRRAKEISPKPNFLILLGDRYGWRPLPEEVSVKEFEILERMEHVEVLRSWYRRDDNAVPPIYVLQSRRQNLGDGKDYTKHAVWGGVQDVLWKIINWAFPANQMHGRFEGPLDPIPPIVRFQASATEQEIWQGAFRVPDAKEHVLAFFRSIKNLDEFDQPAVIKDFVDITGSRKIDTSLATEQGRLKKTLAGCLGVENVFRPVVPVRLAVRSDETGKPKADISTEHLSNMCSDIEGRLMEITEAEISKYWRSSGRRPMERTKRELEIEQLEHARIGEERGNEKTFVGRDAEIEAIRTYLAGENASPLVVHGAFGCGKTALLAAAAREAVAVKPFVRFIGVHPRCSDLRGLLSSLCQELRQHYPREGLLPTEIDELRNEFDKHLQSATSEQPLVLFLDALDQLSDADNGRLLHWVPWGQLSPHVKIVVSCLSDRAEDDPAGQPWALLQRRQFPVMNYINLDALSQDDAITLLFDRWLYQAGRRLTQDQHQRIEQRLVTSTCRQPIYLKLLFEGTRLWRSYDVSPDLGEDVSTLLGQFVKRLSQPANHGPLLVERVLGYLAASRHGLAENEILEILFQDDEYKAALDQATEQTRHELPTSATRIPFAIWSRLRVDLAPYLTERAAPGANVLTFYHRQVGEWARLRDLGHAHMIWHPHERLADFFESKADPGHDLTWKGASSRALEEFPYHLAQNADVPRWERTVCDPLFVEATCRAGLVFDLLRDTDDALIRLRSAPVQTMRKAVASSLRTITIHPEFCLSIICNRLLWSRAKGLIAQYAARATEKLDESGAWLQAASPFRSVESIPLNGCHYQAFIAGQQAFATVDGNGNLEIRSIGRGALLVKRTLETRTLFALAVEPTHLLAAWLDQNGVIRTELSQSVLLGRTREIAVAYPWDDTVIAVSRDGDLVAWNPHVGKAIVLAAEIPFPLVVLRANPDGSRILFVAGDRPSAQTLGVVSKSARGWRTDKLRWNGKPIKHGCLNPAGTKALLIDSGRRMSIVEVTSGVVLASTQYERRSDVVVWGAITACALGKGRKDEIAVVTTDKGQVWAWNWKQDRFTACGNYRGLQESDAVRLMEILPEGERIFISTANRGAFFSIDAGPSAVPHSEAVADCAITESDLVASVCREDRTLKWWRFNGLTPLRSFSVEPPRVVAADASDDCVFLGTDNGFLYRFPSSMAPESKDIFKLFDHPVANIVSDQTGVAISASTQGLIERVDYVADRTEWLCSHTSGHRQRYLLPIAGSAYITVRESDTAGRGDMVALGTGTNKEIELYKSKHSAVLVAASRDGKHVVIYDHALKDNPSLQVFTLEGHVLNPVFAVEANRSICAMHLLLGNEYLLLARRDEPWLELRRLTPDLPVAAVMELPSAPSCLCTRQDKITIGFQSGDILCLRVRDANQTKPTTKG